MYRYFLTYRGFSIGCQPNGWTHWEDVDKELTNGEYCYSVVEYETPLAQEQIEEYELTAETDAIRIKGGY